jgi:ABC-type phosphate transport system substrate-binding protein
MCYFLLICTAQAGNGGLGITVEPNDAEIYVDGQLKTNSSPANLTLPEGKHQVEVKKANMNSEHFEIIIPAESVIVKKVTLTPTKIVTPIQDLTSFLKPEQGKFETDAEFLARRTQLIAEFNQGVQTRDAHFQIGLAKLDYEHYDLKNGIFPVKLEVAAWAKPFVQAVQRNIAALRDDAQNLWQEGEQKQLFAYFKLGKHAAEVEKIVLIGLNKEWTLESVTGHLFVTFPNTLDKLLKQFNQVYQTQFPLVFQHPTVTHSSEETVTALLNHQANVIVLPRRLTEKELSEFEKKFEFEPTEIQIAKKMYAAYVHKANPLDTITIQGLGAMFSNVPNCGVGYPIKTWDQAHRIMEGALGTTYRVFKDVTKDMLGMKNTWEQLPIALFSPSAESLAGQFVKDMLLCGGELKTQAKQYADKDIPQVISGEIHNIGIGSMREIEGLPVKMLKIYNSHEDGNFSSGKIEATVENALQNKYLLTQSIWIYVNVPSRTKLNPMFREMLRVIFSKTGQAILETAEFITLPESEYPEQLMKF